VRIEDELIAELQHVYRVFCTQSGALIVCISGSLCPRKVLRVPFPAFIPELRTRIALPGTLVHSPIDEVRKARDGDHDVSHMHE
jgi:hypothetical protein